MNSSPRRPASCGTGGGGHPESTRRQHARQFVKAVLARNVLGSPIGAKVFATADCLTTISAMVEQQLANLLVARLCCDCQWGSTVSCRSVHCLRFALVQQDLHNLHEALLRGQQQGRLVGLVRHVDALRIRFRQQEQQDVLPALVRRHQQRCVTLGIGRAHGLRSPFSQQQLLDLDVAVLRSAQQRCLAGLVRSVDAPRFALAE
mmetsp:Transcript_11386/g.29325  ORF Transcript_11386/g.29325 Transcript_11386/m.29325 type:complete len:204 (+) Transcript_11386:78-689(+)